MTAAISNRYYGPRSKYRPIEDNFRATWRGWDIRIETHWAQWSAQNDHKVRAKQLLGFDPTGRGRNNERIWIVARYY